MPKYNIVVQTKLRTVAESRLVDQIASHDDGKIIINLIGRTGSGKGTQGSYLSAKTGLPHISIGDLFRDEVRNKTELGKLIEIFEENHPKEFPPDEIWFGILLKRFSQQDCAKGYILDNFPRTPAQAKVFVNGLLSPKDCHVPLFFDLDEKIICERLKNRYICPSCGVQVRAHDGNNSGACSNADCNGQKLEYRAEDRDEQKMQRRFATFNKNIVDILTVMESRDPIYYCKLNGTELPQDIANTIDRIIFGILTRKASRKFFIMRHTESTATYNPELFSERVPDAVPLTKEGHAQAKMAGAALKKYFDQNPTRKLKIIINSATRIIETGEEVKSVLGDVVSAMIADNRANELKHGKFNSVSLQHMIKTYPDVLEKFYYCGNDDIRLLESYKIALPHGESKEDLLRNTTELLFDIEQSAAQNEDILFIGHGANCRALEAALTGKDGLWLAREYDTMSRSEIIAVDVNKNLFSKGECFFKAPSRVSIQIPNKPENRIAIIGAGASGTAILANLVQRLPSGSEIIVFDHADCFGPGYVYDINQPPCFLLNRTLGNTQSIWGSKSFSNWIADNKALICEKYAKWQPLFPDSVAALHSGLENVNANMVVPRSLFGLYLSDCFTQLVNEAHNRGISVVTVNRKVTNAAANHVTCGEGQSAEIIPVDHIVLATGHWQSPKPVEYGYAESFYNSPMVLGLAPIDMPKIKDKKVLIKGTSLSAIDAAIMALELGAKHVAMFSRHGKLSSITGLWKERTLQHLTLKNLEALAKNSGNGAFFSLEHVFQLMVKELEDVGIKVDWSEAIQPKDPIKVATGEIAQCQNGQEFLWQSIFESSFPIHQEIFRRLHPDDKIVFINKWLSPFMSYNATTPLASLERFSKYFADGRLEINAGEAVLSFNDSSATFEAKFQDNTVCTTILADVLIHATGQDRDIGSVALYDALGNSNAVAKNLFGGVRINETYNLIDGDGNTKSNIFAVGPMISGDVLNYSNFETIYQISTQIAAEIAKQVKARPTSADTTNKSILPGFNLYTVLAGAAVAAGCAYYAKNKLRVSNS